MKFNFSHIFFLSLILLSGVAYAENLNLTEVYSMNDIVLGKDYSFKLRLIDSDSGLFVNGANCQITNQINDTIKYITNTETLTTDSLGYLAYIEKTSDWTSELKESLLGSSGYADVSCYCSGSCTLSNGSTFTSYDIDSIILNYEITQDKTTISYNLTGFFIALTLIFAICVWIYSAVDKKEHETLRLIILTLITTILVTLFFMINTILKYSGSFGLGEYGTVFVIIARIFLITVSLYLVSWYIKKRMDELDEA